MRIEPSHQLKNLIRNYRWEKDTVGMSPAQVFKLVGDHDNLYLKTSGSQFHGTTYDVAREKDIILWLNGRLPVPEIVHFEQYENTNFLLMREVEGTVGYEDYETYQDPQRMIRLYSQGIKLFQSISTEGCPFDNRTSNRLNELAYLLANNLADIDSDHWEEDTPFHDPDTLFAYLQANQPQEDLVFSHGDFGDSNIFIKNDQISGFIDLGRSGKADFWYDIAFCVRSIQNDLGSEKEYLDQFFKLIEVEPDWEKIKYYILLDEMF